MTSLAIRDEQLIRIGMQMWPEHWDSPLEMGVEDGIVWAVVRAPIMGVNGYALIPAEGHPWSSEIPCTTDEDGWDRYATEDLRIHGGITYGDCGGPAGWIGFDTAHSGDLWPPEFDPHRMSRTSRGCAWTKEWSTHLVIEEAKKLARLIAAIKPDQSVELVVPE